MQGPEDLESNFPVAKTYKLRYTHKTRAVLNSTTKEHLCITLNKMILRTKVLDSNREYA